MLSRALLDYRIGLDFKHIFLPSRLLKVICSAFIAGGFDAETYYI
jgi:hypothetical protein